MFKQIAGLLVLGQLWDAVMGYCPPGCSCNNTLLMVTCTSSSLDIIPITLNPHITTLSMHNSQVKTIDDGFQFYDALVTLDLSNNQIQTIQDGAFISQVFY